MSVKRSAGQLPKTPGREKPADKNSAENGAETR